MTRNWTVPALVHYLDVHTRWAANTHPAFDEYASDLRDLLTQMEAATHRRRTPVKAGADCFACGGDLIRRVVDGLEEDVVTCRDCREQYDAGRYGMALKAAAEAAARIEVDGQVWATPQSLAAYLERSEQTVRTWHKRGQVASIVRGGVLFLNEDEAQTRHGMTRSA